MQFHTYMFSFQFIHIPSCWPSSYSFFTCWGVSDSVACYAADYMFRTCQLMMSTLTSWNPTSDASSCCQCYGTQGTCQCSVKLTQQLGMILRTDAIVRLLQPLLWTIILCTRQCTLVEKVEFATIVKHMQVLHVIHMLGTHPVCQSDGSYCAFQCLWIHINSSTIVWD